MGNKQIQKAGEGAQQVQAGTINVYTGITEARAREIFSEMNAIARQSYTQDAYDLAWKRVNMFEDLLMQKVEKVDGMLETFADPSFQFLLTEAQRRSAASERDADAELLTELLVHRVTSKGNIKKRASIQKAVEIIDQVDDDSLCALTLLHAATFYIPVLGRISDGIDALSNIYNKLDLSKLPKDKLWIDNLSILGCMTVAPFFISSKYEDIQYEALNGYTCVGIKKQSEEYKLAVQMLVDNGINPNILIDHELNEGYVRLALSQKQQICNFQTCKYDPTTNSLVKETITDKRIKCLTDIFEMYSQDKELKETVKVNFVNLLSSKCEIKKIMDWWNDLGIAFELTSIGKVIASANARRFDNTLPSLD